MKTVIIGLGNPIVGDDAIGIRVVEYLKETYTFPNSTDILADVSLAGLSLVELFRGYEKVIIVDAMQSGKFKPGEVARLNPDQFASSQHISDYHNLDFFTALEWASNMFDDIPLKENIIILGIEISFVQEFSDELTPEIQDKFSKITNLVYEEVRKEIKFI